MAGAIDRLWVLTTKKQGRNKGLLSEGNKEV